ncbi:MAG: 7-cyano-7-deazaguanine synthase [Nitrososphaerales archaeon]
MGSRNISSMVMFSGGIDSSVALFWALRKMPVQPITFDYFRRSSREATAASLMLDHLGLKAIKIGLPFLKEVDDTRRMSRNPKLKPAPSAYVPCRNAILYGIAAYYAEVMDYKYIIGGHNKDDARSFPDASARFFDLFNKMTTMGLYTRYRTSRILLPLSRLGKAGVIRLGKELGVPFELTWSCYFQKAKPCEVCPACRQRRKAFMEARFVDPLAKLKERS